MTIEEHVEASLPRLGPYEHVFGSTHRCVFCGWWLKRELPAGTTYYKGVHKITGPAELHKTEPRYSWLGEQGAFVVEKTVHAGWIDWNESLAPLCKRDP